MPPYCEIHFTYHNLNGECFGELESKPLTFTLTITLGSEHRTLSDIQDAVKSNLDRYGRDHEGTTAEMTDEYAGVIRDTNGNTVGQWSVTQ